MICSNGWSGQRDVLLPDREPEGDFVPGQAEWMALERWNASWRPDAEQRGSIDVLSALYLRVLRQGYAAYKTGVSAMPELFALDNRMAAMWQEGYASARMDAKAEATCRSALASER